MLSSCSRLRGEIQSSSAAGNELSSTEFDAGKPASFPVSSNLSNIHMSLSLLILNSSACRTFDSRSPVLPKFVYLAHEN